MKSSEILALVNADNLRTLYAHTSAQDARDGLAWYPAAHSAARLFSRKYSYSLKQCAAVIAVLSPNLGWNRNLAAAETVIRAHAEGKRDAHKIRCGAYRANVRKALAILSGDLSNVRGLKVTDFYANILARGEAETPCIDTWIIRAATNVPNAAPKSLTPKCYRTIAAAIREAAEGTGLPAAVFQAILWVHIRRTSLTAAEIAAY